MNKNELRNRTNLLNFLKYYNFSIFKPLLLRD